MDAEDALEAVRALSRAAEELDLRNWRVGVGIIAVGLVLGILTYVPPGSSALQAWQAQVLTATAVLAVVKEGLGRGSDSLNALYKYGRVYECTQKRFGQKFLQHATEVAFPGRQSAAGGSGATSSGGMKEEEEE